MRVGGSVGLDGVNNGVGTLSGYTIKIIMGSGVLHDKRRTEPAGVGCQALVLFRVAKNVMLDVGRKI